MPDITLQRGHTAVLIADFYAEIMDTLPHAIDRGVVDKAAAVQAAARNADVMVCYCATVFRPGYPEIGHRNKTFSQRKAWRNLWTLTLNGALKLGRFPTGRGRTITNGISDGTVGSEVMNLETFCRKLQICPT